MVQNEDSYDINYINKCKFEFGCFDNYVKDLYKFKNKCNFSYSSKNNKGYIINFNDLEDFKKKINSYDTKNINRIEQIPFKTSTYLLNMIDNDNKYIIINEELWKTICQKGKENETQITFDITYYHLILYLKDRNLKFLNDKKNNIIEKNFYRLSDNLTYYSNIREIKNIDKSIREYFKFENLFLNNLKNHQKKSYYGYLVDKDWLDEWKKYTNYEELKKKYLEKNNINEKIFIDEIIYYYEQNNKNKKLESINPLNFSKKEEIKSYIKNKSLVLLNKDFIKNYFSIFLDYYRINYYLYNNIIEFTFTYSSHFIIRPNFNIISLNEFSNLKQLTRIFYFQKDLEKKINSPQEINKIYSDYFYIIDKTVIKQYKNHYKYDILYQFLQNYNFKSINYNNFEENFYNILNSLKSANKTYFENIEKQEKENISNNSFDKSDLNIIKDNKKNISYIKDFEIINKDIFLFFNENKIIQNNQSISCNCILGDNKIFISFNFKGINFYEIGFIDQNNKNFIIEYLIKEKEGFQDLLKNYFIESGLKNIILNVFSKTDNNEIKPIYSTYGYYFKIEKNYSINEENGPEDNYHKINKINIEKEKNDYSINIISFLVSLYFFEDKIKNKNLNSDFFRNNPTDSLQYGKSKCYLINKNILSTMKNIFFYNKINDFIQHHKIKESTDIFSENYLNFIKKGKYYEFISSKKIDFEKNINKKIFDYEIASYTGIGSILHYANNFNIITENLFKKLLKVLNLTETEFKKEEFYFNFNNDKIVLTPNENNNLRKLNNYDNLIYIYEILLENNYFFLNYNINLILSFDNLSNLNNNYEQLIKEENILKNYQILEIKYNFKSYLIKNTNAKEITNPNCNIDVKEKEKEQILNKYLSFALNLCIAYSIIEKKINQSINNQNITNEYDYYLINAEFMDEIESILKIDIIKALLESSEFKNIIKNNNVNQILELLKAHLNTNVINELKNINEELLNNKLLGKNNLSKTYIDHSKGLYYYKNCKLINKEIKEIINKMNTNLIPPTKEVYCIFDKTKIIMLINQEIINVGYLDSIKKFKTDCIIHSDHFNTHDINIIFKFLKTKGYKFLESYLSCELESLHFTIDNQYVTAKVLYIKGIKKPLYMDYISEKFKTLLLLALIKFKENNNNFQNKDEKIEKVFLININWLLNYKTKEIYSLILNNNEIKNYILSNKFNYDTNSPNFNSIISKLDKSKINEIDKSINQINNTFSMDANYENIILHNQKNIKIYKKFILFNEHAYNLLQMNFCCSSNTQQFLYIHKNMDILSINDFDQRTILFGKLDKSNNYYDIKYILEYENYNNVIQKVLHTIKEIGPIEYLKEKTVFKVNDNNDNISPIFFNKNNDILGYCYKYYNNINYINCIDYTKYLSNEKFIKVLSLYKNYKKLNENHGFKEEKYYLINQVICNQIKKDCNFDEIKNIFDAKKFSENDINKKYILFNIKNSYNNLQYFLNNTVANNYDKQIFEPNIIPLNKNEQNNPIMIYDNFEIFNQKAANKFFDSLNGYENNCLECILDDEKILIKYPNDFCGNKKIVCIIGILNNDNTFIKEYILIYNDYMSCYSHINELKNNLKNHLNNLQLYNNSQPIINEKYEEVGIIIKVENNFENINYNFNNNTSNNNNSNNNNNFNNYINKDNNMPIDTDYNNNYNQNNNQNNNQTRGKNYKESEYNLEKKIDSPYIKSNFIYPPLIGLENIGATCYMNATVQCFCHIEKFVNFFKYSQQIINNVKQDENKNKLSSSFKLLMEKLWPDDFNQNNSYKKKYYAPYEFKNKISTMNPLFKGVAANDAKDLVNFIIMTLHEELNKAKKGVGNNNNLNIDQRNSQLMFNTFANNFMLENQSIISDLFYGINCNITQCCGYGCGVQTFNYQTYFFLVFPLEEVRKFKSSNQFTFNYNFNFNNNNLVNIYDCFEYDKKIGPEILIILLNRGKGIEFNVKINFVEYLNLANYIQYANTGCNYKLIGVITHMGESGMGGHFISYCLDPISTNTWHKYNDSEVTQVNNFQSEVIDYAMPYLLFYQKIK